MSANNLIEVIAELELTPGSVFDVRGAGRILLIDGNRRLAFFRHRFYWDAENLCYIKFTDASDFDPSVRQGFVKELHPLVHRLEDIAFLLGCSLQTVWNDVALLFPELPNGPTGDDDECDK